MDFCRSVDGMNSRTTVIVISTADILPGRFYFCSNLIICGDKELGSSVQSNHQYTDNYNNYYSYWLSLLMTFGFQLNYSLVILLCGRAV